MPDKDSLDLLLDSALATYADPGPDSGLEQRVLSTLDGARTGGEGRSLRTTTRRWLPWAVAIPLAASLLLWIGIAQFRHAVLQQASGSRPSTSTENFQAASGSTPPARPAPKGHEDSRALKPDEGTRALKGDEGSHTLKGEEGSRALKGHDFSRAANASAAFRALAPEGRTPITTGITNDVPLPKLAVFPTPQPLTPQERALAVLAVQAPAPMREALVAAQEQDNPPVRIAAIHIPPIALSTQPQP